MIFIKINPFVGTILCLDFCEYHFLRRCCRTATNVSSMNYTLGIALTTSLNWKTNVFCKKKRLNVSGLIFRVVRCIKV